MEEHIKTIGTKLTQQEEEEIKRLSESIFIEIIKKKNPDFQLKQNIFLGSHAISMNQTSLEKIFSQSSDYLVCEKSDGIRFIMMITNTGEVILSGRGSKTGHNDYHLVNIPLVAGMFDRNATEKKISFLFDGELITENIQGKENLTYLFFDCMVFKGNAIYEENYKNRLEYCSRFIHIRDQGINISTQINLPQCIVIPDRCQNLKKLSLMTKKFFSIDQAVHLVRDYLPKLSHGTDGLIFSKNSAIYQTGKTYEVLKWKPVEKITIDFLSVFNPKLSEEFKMKIFDLYVGAFTSDHSNETEIEGNSTNIIYVLFDILITNEDQYDQILAKSVPINHKDKQLEIKGCIVECKLNSHGKNEEFKKIIDQARMTPYEFSTNLINYAVLTSEAKEFQDQKERLKRSFEKKTAEQFWIIERYRFDKVFPNTISTALNTLKDIFNGPTLSDIEREIRHMKHGHTHDHHSEKVKSSKSSRKSSYNEDRDHSSHHSHHHDHDRSHREDRNRYHHDHHRRSESGSSDYSDKRSRRSHRRSVSHSSRHSRHSEKSHHSKQSHSHRYRNDSRDKEDYGHNKQNHDKNKRSVDRKESKYENKQHEKKPEKERKKKTEIIKEKVEDKKEKLGREKPSLDELETKKKVKFDE